MDITEREPVETNPTRAFFYGTLAGLLFAQLATGLLPFAISDVLHEQSATDIAVGIVAAIYLLVASGAVAFPIAAIFAAVFLFTMMHLETKHPMFSSPFVWLLIGGVVSTPLGLWLADEFAQLDYDSDLNWNLLYITCGCGLVGGLFAWLGYYGKLRQISSRNSSSTAR